LRCAGKTVFVVTSAAQQRAAQRMCKRPLTGHFGVVLPSKALIMVNEVIA